jgi:Fic family protein
MDTEEKLQLIKRLSGKTQEMLAADLGVSFPTLNSWINGRSIPRKGAEQRIDEHFLRLTGQNVIPGNLIDGKKALILKKKERHPGLLRLLKERIDIYEEFLLSFTYNTNRIEGSTLTEPETAAILFQNTALPDKSIIEQMEVKNHQAAFKYLLQHLSSQGTITEEFVLKMHAILLNGIRDDAGQYRHHAVRIAGSNVPTANYMKVPALTQSLIEDISKPGKDIIHFSTKVHSRFEQIHPFSDGNGRIGRLLLTAILLKDDLPPAIIPQEQRRFYILYLNQAQLKNDYSRLEDFICEAILKSYDILG